MSVTTADVAISNQWAYIVNTLKAEAAPGGRIGGVKYVGKSFSLWTPDQPSIGVQLASVKTMSYASQRRLMTTEFWIVAGAQSTDATAAANMGANTPPNLDDAMTILQGIIGDGTGNGVIPILNDAKNYTLGDYASKSIVGSDISLDWKVGPGEAADIWAYAKIVLYAEQLVFVPWANT